MKTQVATVGSSAPGALPDTTTNGFNCNNTTHNTSYN